MYFKKGSQIIGTFLRVIKQDLQDWEVKRLVKSSLYSEDEKPDSYLIIICLIILW